MQPHSMCAVALAAYMWNRTSPVFVSNARAKVIFTRHDGAPRSLYYDLNVESRQDDTKFVVKVIRSVGGIACSITVWRNSSEEGTRVHMTHAQQHISGLMETYKLYKDKIDNGNHRNSMKYKTFSGKVLQDDRKKLELYSDVKMPRGGFRKIRYDLVFESITEK
ncbi:MAG: hypothetical protein COU65_02895 [Candidatus Pacebacteria bacterium CG10_big_fil_rev_8_21_14_0_10_42_12]|nr:hypothetical protein [Candidatus Paceibacterota bacterium]PIR62535.1 MAG: hypothetical protein COU65_02895 [Candidatus Pacebacteria bacterium CG10_big_fil_rev_8_21_14_0_10_42_12]